ncbi:MAG: UbiA family prenyltransferase [Methanomassiliicoccales archaeon]|nr:UbiA family prenyltransferase [Methanomassiliicoccales archaeon]MDD1756416.1 UbiA family prenyltransferase [Methanomassiliicoccales archaeon]
MSLDDRLDSFQTWATEGLDRLVVWMEKERLPLFLIFLYVLAIGTARDLIEYFLLDPEFVSTSHPWIFSIAHHVAFYLVVFMGLVFLLTAFSGRGTKRCINYVSMFYWIIILPPIIDHFIFGLNENYAYFSITDFINALFHFSGEKFHPGQALEVGVVIFALIAYTVWTSRHQLYSVRDRVVTFARICLLVVFTFVALFIVATPASFLPVSPDEFPYFELTRYYQYHLFFFLYYLLAAVVLALAITYLAVKGRFVDLIRSMRPAQTLLFVGIVGAGTVTGWMYSSSLDLVTKIMETPYWVNWTFVGIALIAAILAWQVSTIWNDISDRSTDSPKRGSRVLASGAMSPQTLWQVSLVLAFGALACSLLLSVAQTAVMATILALAYLYSFKPVRFKDHVLSPLLIGLGTFLAFIFGCLTPYSEVEVVPSGSGELAYLTGAVVFPALTPEALLLGFFMFLGLAIGSMVTDVDGYEEDLAAGVRTVYTKLGLEKGVKTVALLIFFGALTPLFLFQSLADAAVFASLGALAALLFLKYKSSRMVMAVALVGLAYAALRYMEILTF